MFHVYYVHASGKRSWFYRIARSIPNALQAHHMFTGFVLTDESLGDVRSVVCVEDTETDRVVVARWSRLDKVVGS